ncbi:MAG: T9SS type A sorting domain-containing protein, partial [Saprospiraceae bacterium]
AQAGTLTYPPKPTSLVEDETAQARGETEPPAAHWAVDPSRFEHTNTLIGMLRSNGLNATTSDMELGVFVGDELRGTAQAIYIEPLDAHLFFLTTYANTAGELLRFKLYDDATGTVRDLTETLYFAPNQHQGSIENPVPFELQTTSVGEDLTSTLAFDVQPNPFSSETTLRFNLPKAEEVTLTISDAQGREVVRRPMSAVAGQNVAIWNGRSDSGSWLSSGVYTVQLKTAAGSVVRKVVLQRLP